MAASTMDFKQMPKLELHAHLSGSITSQCLHEIWAMKIQEGDEDAKALEDPLKVISGDGGFDLVTFFPLFSKYIYTLVNTDSMLSKSVISVLDNFEKDGVVYLELRTTPRQISEIAMSKEDYVKKVLEDIRWFNSQSSTMVTKLILSIDRRNTAFEAEHVIDLALKYRDQGVVGVDLCGNPAAHDISIFRPAFARAKAAGLGITLHFGEVATPATPEELEELLNWQPDRIGHVIYVPGEEILPERVSAPANISQRPAHKADLPLIYRAERSYMEDIEPSSLAGWESAAERNMQLWTLNLDTTTVLEVDREVAGYVMWQPEAHTGGEGTAGSALIITIAVLPAFRRRGLGLKLLSIVTEQARKQCLESVELGVHRDNPAIALYSSAGFLKTGVDGDYINYSLRVSPKAETEQLGEVARKDLKKVIADRKLGLELCLSCNVKLGMMEKGKGYVDHHFAEWKDTGCPIILCTDDVGIVGSEVSNEYRLVAEHFKMDDEKIKELARSGVNAIFGGQEQKERLRKLMWQ